MRDIVIQALSLVDLMTLIPFIFVNNFVKMNLIVWHSNTTGEMRYATVKWMVNKAMVQPMEQIHHGFPALGRLIIFALQIFNPLLKVWPMKMMTEMNWLLCQQLMIVLKNAETTMNAMVSNTMIATKDALLKWKAFIQYMVLKSQIGRAAPKEHQKGILLQISLTWLINGFGLGLKFIILLFWRSEV